MRPAIEFIITGGEVHDCKVALEFIEKFPTADYIIADKICDSEALRTLIRNKSSTPIIPGKNNSTTGNADMDWGLYKYRHLVENIFARLKHFRSIATRYDGNAGVQCSVTFIGPNINCRLTIKHVEFLKNNFQTIFSSKLLKNQTGKFV